MLGSTTSIACPNTILNTILAEELSQFADILEKSNDFEKDVIALTAKTFKEHSRIIFNGNNYTDEWVVEAEKRGLLNLRTTADALPCYIADKNVKMFEKHHVYTAEEVHSRYEILMDEYCKTIHIEALTMLEMVKKDIYPAVTAYMGDIAGTIDSKKAACADIPCEFEIALLKRLSSLSDNLYKKVQVLEEAVNSTPDDSDIRLEANHCKDKIFIAMQEMRAVVDELETITAKDYWPYPSYTDLLYSVI